MHSRLLSAAHRTATLNHPTTIILIDSTVGLLKINSVRRLLNNFAMSLNSFTPAPLHSCTPAPLHPCTPSLLHPITPSTLSPLHLFTFVCRQLPMHSQSALNAVCATHPSTPPHPILQVNAYRMLARYQPLSESLLLEVRGRHPSGSHGMPQWPVVGGHLPPSESGRSQSPAYQPGSIQSSSGRIAMPSSSHVSSFSAAASEGALSSTSTPAPNVALPVNSQTTGGIPGVSSLPATSSSISRAATPPAPPTPVSGVDSTQSQKTGPKQVKLTPLAKPPGMDPMAVMREREARLASDSGSHWAVWGTNRAATSCGGCRSQGTG